MAAHIVDFSLAALADNQVDGHAVIVNMEPVSDIIPFAVDRQLLIGQRPADHQRNQLLREMVGAVVVGAAGNRHWQPVSPVVGQNKQIRAGLAGGIGAGGVQRRLLREKQIRPVQRQIPVDLVGGYLMITLYAIGAGRIQKNRGAHYVGAHKDPGIGNGPVHMGFGSKVYHHVEFLFLKEIHHKGTIRNIAAHKLVIGLVLHRL